MADTLEDLTKTALRIARAAGAEAADAIAIDATSLAIDVRGGALEQAERSEGIEIGLRVMVGRRQACVSASDTRPETLERLAERAVAMAKEAPEDPWIGLATTDQLAAQRDAAALELSDPAPEPSPADLQEDARRAEAAALAHKGITQVSDSSAAYGRRQIHLATSGGFSGGYSRTSRSTSCVAIAGSGTEMERDYAGESRIYQADLPDAAEIGALAAERTLARQGATKPPTGAFPVIYDERISSGLIGHVLSAINGTAIVRGSSWLRDRMGERILPPGFSIIEDPSIARRAGSKPFDGEGLAASRRALVSDGVLQGWLLDLASARQLGLQPTGNATRGTTAPPSPGVGNITVTEGDKTRDALMREMGTGLLITSMIGSSINPTTGDYSRGASGFWIENGTISYPVNECTVAGNLHEMLQSIIPANDARHHLSRVVPSLLVEGLTIAGA